MDDQSALLLNEYAPEADVAAACGTTISTLRTWAARRKGPGGRVRVGRHIFYRRQALLDWVRSREVHFDGALLLK